MPLLTVLSVMLLSWTFLKVDDPTAKLGLKWSRHLDLHSSSSVGGGLVDEDGMADEEADTRGNGGGSGGGAAGASSSSSNSAVKQEQEDAHRREVVCPGLSAALANALRTFV